MGLREQITEDMKSAMRAKESARLNAIRLLLAAMKQREVDDRIELTDAHVVSIVEKMLKQRRDSIAAFEKGGRQDLADKERAEREVLAPYAPAQMDEAELDAIIDAAIAATGATSAQEMGKVMGQVMAKAKGRVDGGVVQSKVRARLGG